MISESSQGQTRGCSTRGACVQKHFALPREKMTAILSRRPGKLVHRADCPVDSHFRPHHVSPRTIITTPNTARTNAFFRPLTLRWLRPVPITRRSLFLPPGSQPALHLNAKWVFPRPSNEKLRKSGVAEQLRCAHNNKLAASYPLPFDPFKEEPGHGGS